MTNSEPCPISLTRNRHPRLFPNVLSSPRAAPYRRHHSAITSSVRCPSEPLHEFSGVCIAWIASQLFVSARMMDCAAHTWSALTRGRPLPTSPILLLFLSGPCFASLRFRREKYDVSSFSRYNHLVLTISYVLSFVRTVLLFIHTQYLRPCVLQTPRYYTKYKHLHP